MTIHEARKPPAPVTHTVSPETDEPSTGILSFSRGRENVLFVVGEKGRRELEETRREALDKKETSLLSFYRKTCLPDSPTTGKFYKYRGLNSQTSIYKN